MKNIIKAISVLASLALLTGCGALNNSEQAADYNAPNTNAADTLKESSEVPDCCAGGESDCCKEDSKKDCCKEQDKAGSDAAKTAAPEKADLNLGYLNSTAHLLAFVAAEEGYFAEEGLNVTLTQFSSAGELVNGLESGKLDVAFIGSVPTLTFQSQGHDVTIIGGAMTNGHGYVIKSEFAEKDEQGVEILKGRNVASVKNSVQDAELQILLKNAGIEIGEGADKVNIVYFDSQKSRHFPMRPLMRHRSIRRMRHLQNRRAIRSFTTAHMKRHSRISRAAGRSHRPRRSRQIRTPLPRWNAPSSRHIT